MLSHTIVPSGLLRQVIDTLLADAESISGEWGSGLNAGEIRASGGSEIGTAQVALADELAKLLPDLHVQPIAEQFMSHPLRTKTGGRTVEIAMQIAAENADLMRRLA